MTRLILSFLLLASMSLFNCEDDLTPPPSNPSKPVEVEPFSNTPDLNDMVVYEVNMRAMSTSGTFKGVEARLDNIHAIGVNVLWLMPIYPVGVDRGINSPYCVRSYTTVNPELGTLNNLKELVNAAHSRDMAVILDWVANHTSWDHPWIDEHPDWYSKDGNGNIISPSGTNWSDVADLNFNNANMRAEMIASMKYWIDSVGIDGFRCDAVDFVPASFWTTAIQQLEAASSNDLIILAEGGERENFTSGFEMNYAWNFYGSLRTIYSQSGSASLLHSTHTSEYNGLTNGQHKLRYITNHDEWAHDTTHESPVGFYGRKGFVGAFVAASFMGGVPMIYTGQEIAYPDRISFYAKNPIDWTVNPDIYEEYVQIMDIRAESEAVKTGTLTSHATSSVIAFRRTLSGEELLILINVRSGSSNFDVPNDLQDTWTDLVSESEVTLGSQVTMDGYEYRILRR